MGGWFGVSSRGEWAKGMRLNEIGHGPSPPQPPQPTPCHPIRQTCTSTNQSTHQPTTQPIYQPISQLICQPINQSTHPDIARLLALAEGVKLRAEEEVQVVGAVLVGHHEAGGGGGLLGDEMVTWVVGGGEEGMVEGRKEGRKGGRKGGRTEGATHRSGTNSGSTRLSTITATVYGVCWHDAMGRGRYISSVTRVRARTHMHGCRHPSIHPSTPLAHFTPTQHAYIHTPTPHIPQPTSHRYTYACAWSS